MITLLDNKYSVLNNMCSVPYNMLIVLANYNTVYINLLNVQCK